MAALIGNAAMAATWVAITLAIHHAYREDHPR